MAYKPSAPAKPAPTKSAPAKPAPAKVDTSRKPQPYVSPVGSSSYINAQNKAQASAVANKTPTQLYQSMTPTQQASRSKANPTVDVSNGGANLGPAINKYSEDTGKYTSIANPKQGYQDRNQGVSGESPGTSSNSMNGATDGATGAGGGQEKAPEVLGQHQQQVGGMNVGNQTQGGGGSKQDVLNGAVSRGEATVDQSGNVIGRNGQNLGNISSMDMTQSAIGTQAPNANQNIQSQQDTIQTDNKQTQSSVNAIKSDTDLGLSNSPDSPFWNSFGNGAIDAEKNLPGYMNERNKVIASNLMLNNTDMKYYSDAERKDAILKDIIDRQEGGIDTEMQSRYTKTIDNVNNLINRQIPPMKADDYFNALIKGEKIPATGTVANPQLSSARNRFNELQKYSSMDSNPLMDAIKSGDLNKGGQLWNDLLNKGMGESLNKAYSMYNTQTESIVTDAVFGNTAKFDPNKSLADQKSLLDFGTSLEGKISTKIMSLMTEDKLPTLASFLAQDEEVQKAKTASRSTKTQINNLVDQINNFADDIKEKVVEKGGEATDDPFLNAYIAEKTKPFNKQLTTLNSKYRNEIALLSDLSENARTEFETKEYNKNMQIKGYEFILGRLDKQTAEATASKKDAQAQSNRDKSFAFQGAQANLAQSNRQKTFNFNASKTNQPNMQITSYDANGKPVYQYFDQATNSWKSTPAQGQPSGQMVDTVFGGKQFKTDSTVASALASVEEQLNSAGITRDTGAYNGPRSAEEQARLVREGKSWTMDSKHNKGMAVDMYENNGKSSALLPPSPKMVAIMEANGFRQSTNPSDKGHFEYVGKPTTTQNNNPNGLSNDATAIVTGYLDLKDASISGGDRLKLGYEIGKYFESIKSSFKDPNEFFIRKSVIENGKIGQAASAKLESINNVGFQLDNLERSFNKVDTGPLRKLWEKSTDDWTKQEYASVKQKMEAILPDLARGVFGEKGVLTDQDIERYRKTIPNIGNKEDINKQIVENLREILQNTFKETIATEALAGNNVSNRIDKYIAVRDINGKMEDNPYLNTTVEQNAYSNIAPSPYSRRNP